MGWRVQELDDDVEPSGGIDIILLLEIGGDCGEEPSNVELFPKLDGVDNVREPHNGKQRVYSNVQSPGVENVLLVLFPILLYDRVLQLVD